MLEVVLVWLLLTSPCTLVRRFWALQVPKKHSFLKERGLHHAIDYRTGDWEAEVMNITDKKGVELIIDPIGGESVAKGIRCLRSTGRIGMFGISSALGSRFGNMFGLVHMFMKLPSIKILELIDRNIGVFGTNLGHMWDESDKLRSCMEVILQGVEDGWVRPYVDKEYKFDDAASAHEFIEQRQNIGKVMLIP
eukprot:Colp12_sorted_trinity150504_noHs@15965